MKIQGHNGKMSVFFLKHPDFPNIFKGGSTLHNCYILHIGFD